MPLMWPVESDDDVVVVVVGMILVRYIIDKLKRENVARPVRRTTRLKFMSRALQ